MALRLLSEGKSYGQTAREVEVKRREDEGLPRWIKKNEAVVWHARSVYRLAYDLPKYLPIMRTYYGERDEYYLNLTPELHKVGQKPIPPIPRPTENKDGTVHSEQHHAELDVVLPRDSPDSNDEQGVSEGT